MTRAAQLAKAGSGGVLQVVQVVPTPVALSVANCGGDYTTAPTTSNTVLAFSGQITLSSATSKVLVMTKVNVDSIGTLYEQYCCLFRGANYLASHSWYCRVSGSEPQTHVINYMDSPGTAGVVQYDIRFMAYGASPTLHINRFAYYQGGSMATNSTLILTEIAG